MKILLFGRNGQVGWELQRSLSTLGELIAVDFDSPAPLTADFSRPETLMALVRSIALNHWYHHRGQLSVYLRLLDIPVPSIYGPSADENPFAART